MEGHLRGCDLLKFFNINRARLRFCGIGPYVTQDESQSRDTRTGDRHNPASVWPRDVIDPKIECKKVIDSTRPMITEESQTQTIEKLVNHIYVRLKQCKIDKIFNESCRLRRGCFDRINFSIETALEEYTDYHKVLALLHRVLCFILVQKSYGDRCTPLYIFGSNYNYSIFKRSLKWLIIGNSRMRSMKLIHFIEFEHLTLRLDDITWLRSFDGATKQLVFLNVLHSIIKIVLDIIRRYFYITVSNKYGSQLLYYRYDLWQKMSSIQLNSLIQEGVLQPVDLRNVSLTGISRFRFHTKVGSLRLICAHRKTKNIPDPTFFQKLSGILKSLLECYPNYRKFDLTSLAYGLKEFRTVAEERHKKIFIVRADLKDCFQSVNQERLMEIIRNRLRTIAVNDCVVLTTMNCTRALSISQGGKVIGERRSLTRYTLTPDKFINNPRYVVAQKCNAVELCVDRIVDMLSPVVIKPVLTPTKKFEPNFGYQLLKGLRQGSALSPKLNSIYVQEAFNEHLKEFINSDTCRLFRYVDDILFLTTDLDQARHFIHRLMKGFGSFNLFVNVEKLKCNFHFTSLNQRINDHAVFYKQRISVHDLSCTYDYSHCEIGLQYTIKVNPYISDKEIQQTLIRSDVPMINFDCILNGPDVTLKNIFERALLSAHRAATLLTVSIKHSAFNSGSRKSRIDFVKTLYKTITAKLIQAIMRGVTRGLIIEPVTSWQLRLLVITAFCLVWNRPGVRHRADELKVLRSIKRRAMMKYLVLTPKPDDMNVSNSLVYVLDWELRIKELERLYPLSAFFKQVSVPSKKWMR